MRTSVHLTFRGQCEEAFKFYERALGGSRLSLYRHGDTPGAADVPPDWRDKIVHGSITIGGHAIAGADVRREHYERPRGFYLLLDLDDAGEATRLFAALADGGETVMPLQKTFWSPAFGVVIDRFGTPWELSVAGAAP
jgi:PhnB protein